MLVSCGFKPAQLIILLQFRGKRWIIWLVCVGVRKRGGGGWGGQGLWMVCRTSCLGSSELYWLLRCPPVSPIAVNLTPLGHKLTHRVIKHNKHFMPVNTELSRKASWVFMKAINLFPFLIQFLPSRDNVCSCNTQTRCSEKGLTSST